MRSIPRTIAGLVVAGCLLLPATQITHAAPSVPSAQQGTWSGRLNAIAAVEGVTPRVLQQDLQAGQTLLQIAVAAHSAHASSAQALAAALLAPAKSRLDQAVAAGRVTQAQETQRYSAMLSRVTILVTTPHPRLFGGLGNHGGLQGNVGASGQGLHSHGMLTRGPLLSTLATTCQTTAAALTAAIHTGGKSILAICQATNSSVQQATLVNALLTSYKARLDTGVTAGRISASQESQLLTAMKTRFETLVSTPLPAGTNAPAA
jgi:hypothetical protein